MSMVDTGEVETAQQEESVVRGRHLDRLNRWLTLAANLGVLL